MQSIVLANNSIPCPNCSHPVNSYAATCAKCGLTISGEGIAELAEINERNLAALNHAAELRNFAISAITLLVAAYFVGRVHPSLLIISITFVGIFFVGFWSQFVRWHLNYRGIKFPDENFEAAVRLRNVAALAGTVTTSAYVAFIYFNW